MTNTATEPDNANTEIVEMQNIAAANTIANQLNQIQVQMRRMEQRILQQLSRSCVDTTFPIIQIIKPGRS